MQGLPVTYVPDPVKPDGSPIAVISASLAEDTYVLLSTDPIAGASYQWLLGNQPLTGATNASLEVASMHLGTVGAYRVQVTVDGVSVLSDPMTLALGA